LAIRRRYLDNPAGKKLEAGARPARCSAATVEDNSGVQSEDGLGLAIDCRCVVLGCQRRVCCCRRIGDSSNICHRLGKRLAACHYVPRRS